MLKFVADDDGPGVGLFYVAYILPARRGLAQLVRLFRHEHDGRSWLARTCRLDPNEPGYSVLGQLFKFSITDGIDDQPNDPGYALELVYELDLAVEMSPGWWAEFHAWRDGPPSPGVSVDVAEWHQFLAWRDQLPLVLE